MRETAANPTILSMILLGGATSLLVGNAFQAQMPEFAHDFGHEKQDWAYSILLGANAGGAAIGGLLLEGTGMLRPNARNAAISSILWCVAIVGFADVDELSSGNCVAVLCGIPQFDFSLDGANPGATAGAGSTARALDRLVQHVEQWPRHLAA